MTHAAGSPDANALGAYLEGKLEPPERAAVEEHLSRCRECRSALATFARAREAPRPARMISWLAAAAALVLATALGVRVASRPDGPAAPASPPARTPEAASPMKAPSDPPVPAGPEAPAARPAPAVEDPARESLETRRSGHATVGGKTFDLIAGRWTDRDFDPDADLPTVTVSTALDRKDLFARIPELAPCALLGDRVLVVHGGTVYRFEPPGP
ncbi:MAG TPA: zf-HC2 domain-containing protein [Thermoanaerobaculia bacterium]|nr:zf-HC2 domain-containing protein [Thermoanaerobaculia bacterium]